MQRLNTYLTGTEFQQCVRSIVRAFQTMQTGLEQEKRAMKKIWTLRGKQIEAVIDSTTCIVGTFGGIAEGVMLPLPELDLDPADEIGLLAKTRRVETRYLASG